MFTIDSEIVKSLLSPYTKEDVEKIVSYGHQVFLTAESIVMEGRASEQMIELETQLLESKRMITDLQTKLKQQQQTSVEACIEKVAESAVVRELKEQYEVLRQQMHREYQSKVDMLQFKEIKFVEEIEFLKTELSTKMTGIETSVRTSLEPFSKKATSAEKGQLGEQISTQWFDQLYPGILIEDVHAQEGYGDIHVLFPNGTRIMVESKNVQRSQRTKDCGKFVKNALQLFSEGKIHGAVYQSHNNEDTSLFPNMEHNPGIIYLDKEKKLMVAVLMGPVCSKENTFLLVNVILDHVRSNKLNEQQMSSDEVEESIVSSSFEKNCHVSSLKEAYRTGMKTLIELEFNRDFYKEQMNIYGERLSNCVNLIEEARISLLHIKSSAPPYFFEEKDFTIESKTGKSSISDKRPIQKKNLSKQNQSDGMIDKMLGEQIALKVHPCRDHLFEKSSSVEKTFLRSFLKSNEKTKNMTMKELEDIHREMCTICSTK